MLLIPAIDLKNGRCVRLLHGEADKETVYSHDPVQMAKKWISQGASRLHIIDLDGAFSGEPKNLDWVRRIKTETGVTVQLGGGLRSEKTIAAVLDSGIDFVILGTLVFTDSDLTKYLFKSYQDRIMVAIDARNGKVSIKGWTDEAGIVVDQAIQQVEEMGGRDIIFTDIRRDGTLEGPNLASIQDVMLKTKLRIFASGGISTLDDIEKLKIMGSPGCILGKAIYENKFDFSQALSKVHNRVG
ncbi:1-(5-phosphoribosyl)-5-[(5-phosphoribosylamino)methylideneamino]imidazole-4-carboxamide isomerase [bacterium F11]|nr:1-(5-phosphoribosyl)-5-[(5-phosphoribosylamino)methylideneamino]imidazole-4-carboxamide isomerase [bacterium F11]